MQWLEVTLPFSWRGLSLFLLSMADAHEFARSMSLPRLCVFLMVPLLAPVTSQARAQVDCMTQVAILGNQAYAVLPEANGKSHRLFSVQMATGVVTQEELVFLSGELLRWHLGCDRVWAISSAESQFSRGLIEDLLKH